MSDWNSDSDDERRISNQTWNKLQKTHLTTGYREGALAGEDEQFQIGFDKGFQDGFKKSYDLATKHGEERIRRFMSMKDQGLDVVENLRVTIKALCNSHTSKK